MATASRTRVKIADSVRALDLERIILLSWDEQPPVLVYVAETAELAQAFKDGFNFCQDGADTIDNLIGSRAVTAAEVLDDPRGYSLPNLEGGAT